jgi:hypothetical protein
VTHATQAPRVRAGRGRGTGRPVRRRCGRAPRAGSARRGRPDGLAGAKARPEHLEPSGGRSAPPARRLCVALLRCDGRHGRCAQEAIGADTPFVGLIWLRSLSPMRRRLFR